MSARTKIEIIEETAAFFNLGNRGYENFTCSYRTSKGKMCAVGRCLTEKGIQIFTEINSAGLKDSDSYSLQANLKEEYLGHSLIFWQDLQNFHDDYRAWNTKGLSRVGITLKNNLIKEYGEN